MNTWKPYYNPRDPWDQLCLWLNLARKAHWAAANVNEYLRTWDDLRAIEQRMNEFCALLHPQKRK